MDARSVTSADGFQIAYEVDGAGPPLLLLHGFSNGRTLWSRYGWVDRLRAEFTVVTMDLRGCGQSSARAEPADYGVERHLADVDAVLEACEVDQLRLWGWSFGATIGLHLAARSRRVVQAVLAGTYFGRLFDEAYIEPRVRQLQRLVRAQAEGNADQLELSHQERTLVARGDLPVYLARVQALLSWPGIEPRDLRCPSLIYTGTEDGNVVGSLEKQRATIEAAGHRLHVFDGLNHIQLLSETDTVLPLIRMFLNPG